MKYRRLSIVLALAAVFFLLMFVWSISLDPPEFLHYVGVILLAYTVALGIMYWRFLKNK